MLRKLPIRRFMAGLVTLSAAMLFPAAGTCMRFSAGFCMTRQIFSRIFRGEFSQQALLRSRALSRINRPFGIYESWNNECMVRIQNPRTRTGEKLNEA